MGCLLVSDEFRVGRKDYGDGGRDRLTCRKELQTANEFLDLPEHGPAELRDSTSSLSATCLVCGKMVGAESVDVC